MDPAERMTSVMLQVSCFSVANNLMEKRGFIPLDFTKLSFSISLALGVGYILNAFGYCYVGLWVVFTFVFISTHTNANAIFS